MNKLAIRQKIGKRVYYTTTFTFKEVVSIVRRDWKEEMGLDNTPPDERLQRDITSNLNKIATYIKNQSDIFFNSLVLAVYDGDPQWREIRIDYGDGEIYDVGVLELTGADKIFPVDGQHRVEGIRKVMDETNGHREADDNYFSSQTIPVILISHDNDKEGKKSTRRLFTTLNRYAKPVNKTDIILLDEDDTVAIATRGLQDSMELFKDERLLLSQSKAISDSDRKSFTNIQVLYECNTELLKLFLDENELYSLDDGKTRLRGNKNGVEQYIRFRRSEDEISKYIDFVKSFWNAFSALEPIQAYLNNKDILCHSYVQEKAFLSYEDDDGSIAEFDELFLRGTISDKENSAYALQDYPMCPEAKPWQQPYFNIGGNLLFRPIGQIAAVKAAIRIYNSAKQKVKVVTWNDVFKVWRWIDFSLGYNLWTNIAYNPNAGMITSNTKLLEELLAYVAAPALYPIDHFDKLVDKYIAATSKNREKPKFENDEERVEVELRIKKNAINEIKSYTVCSIIEEYKKWENGEDMLGDPLKPKDEDEE